MDDDDFLRGGVVDKIREYLEDSGLIDRDGEFEIIKDDVVGLAASIVQHVESQYGM